MSAPLVGLKFKEQLPYGPIRDEFEQLVAAIQAGFSQLSDEIDFGVVTVSNFIVSCQEVTVTIPKGAGANLTATATLTVPVDPRYTEITFQGMSSDYTTAGGFNTAGCAYISALTETTITATRTRDDTLTDAIIKVRLTQYRPTALRSNVQIGVITMAAVTTNTAGIQSVGPKSGVNIIGWTSNPSGGATPQVGSYLTKVTLTSATVVTASRSDNTGTIHVGFCVVDFN